MRLILINYEKHTFIYTASKLEVVREEVKEHYLTWPTIVMAAGNNDWKKINNIIYDNKEPKN